jgi:ligand-binding sensor domain-containing protein
MRSLAVLCLWLGIHVYAYPQEYTVRKYTMEQGLPADIVYEITQDNDGYIWVATTNGLCRYDGFVFKEYANGHIFAEDMPWLFNYYGEIYVLTWSGKLGHINNDSLLSFPKLDIPSGIRHFMRDRRGGYWIKAARREILHIYQGKIECLSSLDSRTYEDKDGTVYTYSHGLSYYDVKKRKLITIKEWLYDKYTISGGMLIFHDDSNQCRVYKNIGFREKYMSIDLQKDENGRALQIQHLLKKNANEYWFQDYKNIMVYDSLGVLRENITGGIHKNNLNINTFFVDREDNVWIGTRGQGIFLLQKKPVKNTFPVKDTYISQLEGNTKGDIMAAHLEGRISLLDHHGGYHTYTIPGSTANIFYGVHASQENFLGVFGQYLFFLDKQQRMHVSLIPSPVKDIGKEKTDHYITGHLNEEAWGYSYLKRNNGDLWVGTNMGIYVVPADGIPRFAHTSVKEFRKFNISPHKKGWTMDSRFEEIKAYKMDIKGTGENTATFIRQLLADDRGVIWIATQCEGIFAYYKDVFYHFTKSDGLLSNNINSIYIDSKNRLWICSNVGITYITPEGSIQYITTEDGIRSNQVNGVFVSDRDEVYLGTAKGLSMVDLSRKTSFTPYPPILLKVKVNDSIYSLHDTSLVLSHRENNIQVDYISVSFNSPLRYMYFIEGLMHKWETTGSQSIYLPRMGPGDYRLKIKSVRQDGEESREVVLLKFTITAPFWKYNIFWVVVLVAVAILVYLFGYYRRKRAMAQLRLRQKISDLEKKALLSQINPHFVFNCLAAIKYLLTNGEIDKAEEYIQKFAILMRNTLDFSENKLISLRDEATYIENYLALEELRFGQAYGYEIKIGENIDTEQLFLPPMLLQPYIENAIRHGLRPKKDKGWLSVHFYTEEEYLYIKIDDNGVGRREAARLKEKNTIHYQSKGMDISKQRAFLQDIKVTIVDKKTEDGQSAGTHIILKISQI